MAYDSNINPGNPPLVWSRIRDAFDKINANFTIIGSTLSREADKDIAHVESGTPQSNPVKVVCVEEHLVEDGQEIFIKDTGISQLDKNNYYVKTIDDFAFHLYTDEALTIPVDGTSYDAYASGGGTFQAFTEYASTDFENLATNVSPARTDEFNLGASDSAWQRLYVSEYSTVPGMELNGVWLGTAQIKGSSGVVDLPLGSTVNGELIINPDQTFFKSVQIDNGDRIVADDFVDTLNLLSGSGVSMSADSGAESITIENTGVTSNVAGSGIGVSSATGAVTVTNTGVRSLQSTTALPSGRTEGAGININGSTGDNLKVTNTGVLEIQAGSAALTVFTDAATGIVTITNAAPAGNSFRFIDVDSSMTPVIEANSTGGTLNFVSGSGINVTGDAGSDEVTIAFSGRADLTGSVFADDSTLLVDAVEGKIVGTVEANVTGNVIGDLTGNSTGYHTGDVKGSIFGDDSTKLIDAVEGEIYGDFYGTLRNQTWMAAYDGFLTIANGGSTGPGPIQIVASGDLDLSAGAGQTINANRNIVASGGVTGNTTGYHTGDVTGSVFADNSTMLVDGTNGVLRGTHVGDLIGSVFADNSTLLVNAVDGTLAYDPATPSDWSGDAPTTVGEAIDRLATLVKTLNGGTGA